MALLRNQNCEKNLAYQKYVLLSSQQEELRQKLSQGSVYSRRTSSIPDVHSPTRSPVGSPIRRHASISPPTSILPSYASPPAMIGTTHEEEDIKERLQDINQQIKATLTSLLNCESVRHDEQYRSWVQDRLMDTEMEIRKQRRHHRTSLDRTSIDGGIFSPDGFGFMR
ncbi:hypothetical protein M501DRAFT_982666 [Patellaria atrata CBS 101060]|uniref:Uncharacterized protein n=1 Tax=Patellaria atrata CBS 101060 TaxID=1346257 RepID=A0A9P4S4K9_9PEZI|nr:hypothetical protein M501DRAFT_982666 [Patellaria atrata CBS 101060]